MRALPFFPPAVFEDDRATALQMVFEVGTAAAQQFLLGTAVSRLEDELCRDTGARYGIACGSGSAALTVALAALDVGAGDEVIVPAFGCQPIADSVANRGAVPVFADVDAHALVLDPAAVAGALTARTVAVMPAHLFSVMADMAALRALADRYELRVVEDAAVAHGAVMDGVFAGCAGDAGVLSFSQFKPLGGTGEGGIVLTDDEKTARRCRLLRDHGGSDGYHELIGYSSRMDEILARFLLHRRPGIPLRMRRKIQIAERYTEAFAPLAEKGLLRLPPIAPAGERWCHVYALLTERRDELRDHLKRRGIGTHVYYPVALPRQPAFAEFARGQRFPHAEAAGRNNLALPVWSALTDAEVDYVAESVLEFYR